MAGSAISKILAITAIFAMVATITTAAATTKGRIIPTDKVSFHKDGRIIAEFTSQTPINDSALITCNKVCSVRLNNMSLNVADNTTFAVRDNGEVINLYVKEGLITFSVNNVTQQLSFYTPDGRYVKTEGFIAPTSADKSIKGYINVVNSQAQIGVNQGGMILATADGIQTVDQGYTYSVYLNELPATSIGSDVDAGFNLEGLLIGGGTVGAAAAAATLLTNSSNITSPQGSKNK